MTFFDVITFMIERPAWSVKVFRRSDHLRAIIMDHTGSFMIGGTEEHNKQDYSVPFLLSVNSIKADNWDMFTNCKWSD